MAMLGGGDVDFDAGCKSLELGPQLFRLLDMAPRFPSITPVQVRRYGFCPDLYTVISRPSCRFYFVVRLDRCFADK